MDAIDERKRLNDKFENDRMHLGRTIERESKLGRALDIGDVAENRGNVAYDDDGKLMAIDPFIGNELELGKFGNFMGRMAQSNQPNMETTNILGVGARNKHKELAQGFREVDPIQFTSFNQLYNDQEQFKPWDAVEERLFNDPESFGERAPNETQTDQLTHTIRQDDERYKDIGNALNWMNTPPEQKRLFEFGDNPHASNYRSMLNELSGE